MDRAIGGDARVPRTEPPQPPVPVRGGLSDFLRHLLLHTWTGRVLIAALAAKAVLITVAAASGPAAVPDGLETLVALTLWLTLAIVVWRVAGRARRLLLWRVRRRLIISYIFIGVVPALLLVAFFLLVGLMMFVHVSAYLFKRGIDDIVDDARVLAQTAAAEVRRGAGAPAAHSVLERKLASNADRYPGLSLALVPRRAGASGRWTGPVVVGAWEHAEPPTEVPEWVSIGGFGGLLAFEGEDRPGEPQLVVRAAGFADENDPAYGVIVDIPIDEQVAGALREKTGIDLQSVGIVTPAGETPRPAAGRARGAVFPRLRTAGGPAPWSFTWMTFFDHVDWVTSRTGTLAMTIRVRSGELYQRVSAAQSRIRNLSVSDLFVLLLGALAILFLLIQTVAFVMGFALARSITGAVHQLFVGTERVRSGDFTHRIHVKTRDQLGELAESFNSMTASIESLLKQAEEKKRLEEELRIARDIQMSLLPHDPLRMPGLAVTAVCLPAREVGGDYYDFFRLGEMQLGVLIADVAGKGTSAALYMAELKGLVLSLSRIHRSPKQLLIEVNRIISATIDSRSFITMTYAIVDLEARTLTYARAGHTPLIYLPAADGSRREAQVLAPDGLVLGLRLEGVARKFEQLLDERSIPLGSGDLFVLFTDGITEAMNPAADMFGDRRLQQLVEEHGHLPSDQLRERILREVEAFVGSADQHDDMTMILLKVEDAEVASGLVAHASVAAR